MKTRNKIFLSVLGLVTAACALMAASPSFSDFISSQFARTTDYKVTIKSGVTLTNAALANSYSMGNYQYTLQNGGLDLRMQMGSGGYFKFVDDGNGYIDTGLALTNSADISSPLGEFAQAAFNGAAWSTNAQASASAVDMAVEFAYTNCLGNITFTGVANSSTKQVRHTRVLIDANGTNRTLTLPASWIVKGGVRTITVTNGVCGVLDVWTFARQKTNAFYDASF
jgi:hypothetical protein